jgi:hypothetical protein
MNGKRNVVYIHNAILISFRNRENPVICDHMDEPGRHAAE